MLKTLFQCITKHVFNLYYPSLKTELLFPFQELPSTLNSLMKLKILNLGYVCCIFFSEVSIGKRNNVSIMFNLMNLKSHNGLIVGWHPTIKPLCEMKYMYIKSTFLYGDKHYKWKLMIYCVKGCDTKFWASVSPGPCVFINFLFAKLGTIKLFNSALDIYNICIVRSNTGTLPGITLVLLI